jgi:hypothetical protein
MKRAPAIKADCQPPKLLRFGARFLMLGPKGSDSVTGPIDAKVGKA